MAITKRATAAEIGRPFRAPSGIELLGTGGLAARIAVVVNGGKPTTGTWRKGDLALDLTGGFWLCTVAGSPGTWIADGAPGGFTDPTTAIGDMILRDQIGLDRLPIGGAGQLLTVKNLGNYALAVMNLGPYSYYRLNEASGTTMTDSTAAHHNGTYSAAGVTYHVAPATGDSDFAVTYNGTSGYSSIANPLPSGDWSVAFFFKGSAAAPATSGDGNYNSRYPLLSTFNATWSGSAAQNGAGLISINAAGQIQIDAFYWNSNLDNGSNGGLHGSGALNNNAWHHCVVTFQQSSGTFTAYIDGAAIALTGTNGWRPGLVNFSIPGTMDFAANPGPSGAVCFTPYSLDEVSIFDAVLTAAQATNLYNQASGVAALVPSWQDAPASMTNPMTTQDDIIVGGAAGAPARLGKGSNGYVLTVDPATGHIAWIAASSGFADPTTTKGDIIVHGTTTTRLPVGTDGQVLTARSTATNGVDWEGVGTSTLGTLGYAQVTADQGSITTNVDLTGLAVTVTVATGRRIRITASCLWTSTVGNDQFQLFIMEGATQLNTSLAASNSTNFNALFCQWVATPSAGSHTYKLMLGRNNGTGTGTMRAGGSFPAFILVEDIGT